MMMVWEADVQEGGLQAQTAALTHASRRAPLEHKHGIIPQHAPLPSLFVLLIHQRASACLQVSSRRPPGEAAPQTGRC